jgi:hypothetical protein
MAGTFWLIQRLLSSQEDLCSVQLLQLLIKDKGYVGPKLEVHVDVWSGRDRVGQILNPCTKMDVKGQFHVPVALLRAKEPPVPTE